jgi:hypothetical protein
LRFRNPLLVCVLIGPLAIILAAHGGPRGGDRRVAMPASNTVLMSPGARSVSSLTATIVCGQTLTADTTLDADLACPPGTERGLIIGASNITLDLGGHVITGDAPGGMVTRGIVAANVAGVIIRNGTVEEFDEGVDVFDSRNVTLENLSIRNLRVSDPAHFVAGVNIANSSAVLVTNAHFEFLPIVFHKEAIDVYRSDLSVRNIEVNGGGVGVNFSFAGACDPALRSTGEVLNSRFADLRAGVLVACSSGARIAGNDFDCPSAPGYCEGVRVYGPFAGAVSGVHVEGNTIRNGFTGINYEGITQSTATNNTVSGNTGWGIGLRQTQGEDGAPISYPSGNTISGNLTWGNGTDLYDDGTGQNHTWVSNICETKQGAAIPACSGLTVITHPSDQRVVAGTPATFSASATYALWPVNPPPVQWQVRASGGATWTDASGATSATYSVLASVADSGKQYRAVFTRSGLTATTKAASLTVGTSPSAPAVTRHPAHESVPPQQTATFSAAVIGMPAPSVRWQTSTDGGTKWVDLVNGATSSTYSLTAWASDNGRQYRAVFTNSEGTATTNAATLRVVLGLPTFTDDPLTATGTRVKAVHITELRQAIAALRARHGLGASAWTDDPLGAGKMIVKAAHLAEMREAVRQVYVAAGQTAPAYTDPTLTAGSTTISAAHIAELRQAVRALW